MKLVEINNYELLKRGSEILINIYFFSNDAATSTTVWSACHLPQNRDIFATAGGNGTVR